MADPIVHTSDPITLIGAGQLSQSTFKVALTLTNQLVAADGGAGFALGYGAMPDVVIGDMDSLATEDRDRIDPTRCHQVSEQETTDFEKVLQRVHAGTYIAVGFLGARIDHSLACLSTLCRFCDRKIILLGEDDVVFLVPPTLILDLPVGTRFSLYPLGDVKCRSNGLEWPLDGLNLSPLGQIGTSNRVAGPVQLTADGPSLLCIVPAGQIRAVLKGMQTAAPWPVRAE